MKLLCPVSQKIKIFVKSYKVYHTRSPSFSSFPIEWCNEFLGTIYGGCKRISSDPGQAQNDQETRNNQSALETTSVGEML